MQLLLAGCGLGGDGPCAFAPVDAGVYGDIPAVYFTEAPAAGDGTERFYIASAGGGLWVTTGPPAEGGGFTVPLNDQARSESEVGVDAPVPADLDPGDGAAQEALRCAGPEG